MRCLWAALRSCQVGDRNVDQRLAYQGGNFQPIPWMCIYRVGLRCPGC